jgi:Methylamine utilisation protein MauE
VIPWSILVATTVAAALLVAAGLVKLARPLPTARALYGAGLPGSRWAARGVGAAEVIVGVWFLAAPSAAAAIALGTIYLGFTGFVAYLVVAHPEAGSCGCAGAKDVPPSGLHAGLNLAAALAAFGALAWAPPALGSTLAALGIASVPFLLGLGTAGALAVVATTDLPPALGAYRRPTAHPVEADMDRHRRADRALASAGVGPQHPSLWPGIDPDQLGAAAAPERDARG